MNYFFIGLLIIFINGFVSIAVHKKIRDIFYTFFTCIGAVLIIISSSDVIFFNNVKSTFITMQFPIEGVLIKLDLLASFFAIIISLGAILTTIYSIGYLKIYTKKDKNTRNYYFFLSLLISSMLMVVVVQQSILFLFFWEIMSLSSFFLVIFEYEDKEAISAGIYYFISMQIGFALILIGFIYLSTLSNSYNFNDYRKILSENRLLYNILFILFFVGFGFKAGFVPFHTWLSKAHPASPTPISSVMSGIMIKTGIYGILRILNIFGTPTKEISYFVLIISIFTGILGVLLAITQHDLKKLLAYHSIENIGIIGIGISIGMLGLSYNNEIVAFLGFSGCILHIFNHFLFKSLLFDSAGAIYQKTRTRNIDVLGGLIKRMPYTALFFLIGSIAIIGLPPLNGFISEFLIYLSIIKAIMNNNILLSIFSIITIASFSFIGALALLCFSKVFSIVFLGNPRINYDRTVNEVNIFMIVPMLVLSLIIIYIGIFPHFILPILSRISLEFIEIKNINNEIFSINKNFSIISLLFLIFFSIIFVILILRLLILKNKKIEYYKTWDCGYQKGNSQMQYKAGSFSDFILRFLKYLVYSKTKYNDKKEIFPKESEFHISSMDIFEHYLINPFLSILKKFFNLFSWVQSGNTQQYILYGILFLIAILIWLFGIK